MYLDLCRTTLDKLVDLRHEILRHGLPRDAAVFAGDETPDARHYGAFEAGSIVGCATLHPSTWEAEPAWQLRGMAVAADRAGRGVGRKLLEFLESDVTSTEAASRLLWCNARVPAAGFYQRQGWTIRSEVFDIPTAGPHVRMTKRL